MTDDEKIRMADELVLKMRALDPTTGAVVIAQNLGNQLGGYFMELAFAKMLTANGPVDAAAMASGLMTVAYLIAKKECGQMIEPQWTMKKADA